MVDHSTNDLSRRDALKLLGAAAGATVLANLPSKWSTPRLAAGVLPAHAQTSIIAASGCPGLGLTITMQISPRGSDIDLMLYTPAGFKVTPKPSGPNEGVTDPLTGATHSGDAPPALGIETIIVPDGHMTDGLWVIGLLYVSGPSSPAVTTLSGACNVVAVPFMGLANPADPPPGDPKSGFSLPILIENCVAVECPLV